MGSGQQQQHSGNKPPLISGSPIYGGKSDENQGEKNEEANVEDSSSSWNDGGNSAPAAGAGGSLHSNSEDVSAFYRISCHLYGESLRGIPLF